jgi:hypothetical protein
MVYSLSITTKGIYKPLHKMAMFALLLFLSTTELRSQSEHLFDSSRITRKLEFSADYLAPTRYSNQVNTASFHTFIWKKYFNKISILASAGLSTSYAWGEIQQYIAVDTNIYVLHRPTSAFGLGPVIRLDHPLLQTKPFTIFIDASLGILLYDKRFPYGGAIYNFMFRAGPSLGWQLKNNRIIKIGYRWMHVSNGKGIGPQNPYYEAQGVNIALVFLK